MPKNVLSIQQHRLYIKDKIRHLGFWICIFESAMTSLLKLDHKLICVI